MRDLANEFLTGRIPTALACAAIVAVVVLGCASTRSESTASSTFSTARTGGAPAFDADRAFGFLRKQVELGPRVPNTKGHEAGAKFIQGQLKGYADSVRVQPFTQKIDGQTLRMQNIIATFNDAAKDWVLLAAHWDTRPVAEYEVDAEKRQQPIPGANDGASGVALLLELARTFAARKPDVGVMMVFFDGEDYGPGADDMFLGSTYFANNLRDTATVNGKPVAIRYGILVDMIGDRNLGIYQEGNSMDAAPEVVKKVWSAAAELGYAKQFIAAPKHSISDDHIPLIRAGVKCIDIIDFDYGPWHTLDDTVDKCSPDSLKAVGETVAKVIYEEPAS